MSFGSERARPLAGTRQRDCGPPIKGRKGSSEVPEDTSREAYWSRKFQVADLARRTSSDVLRTFRSRAVSYEHAGSRLGSRGALELSPDRAGGDYSCAPGELTGSDQQNQLTRWETELLQL